MRISNLATVNLATVNLATVNLAKINIITVNIALIFLLISCDKQEEITSDTTINNRSHESNLRADDYIQHNETYNQEAPIPPQCYTKTDGKFNPCYVCHQSYNDKDRPNMMRDGYQQGSYAFSEIGEHNSWSNLFKDRQKHVHAISDDEILEYVKQNNYDELIDWMKSDAWQGVIPEIKNLSAGAIAFDENGLALDNSGWVAFNYKPFPSTFWPTNGSTDDSMIRLENKFQTKNGKFSRDVYYANLSLIELTISGRDNTSTVDLNEQLIGEDVDGDGRLSPVTRKMTLQKKYFGDASDVDVHAMLYPTGTEFLHTVRYIDIDDNQVVGAAPRLKELRYMRKQGFRDIKGLASNYYHEFKEKHFEKLPQAMHKGEQGIANTFGWTLLGFIENEHGVLRKQHNEEHFYCVGCHKSIGTTIDHTFSFPRKVAGRDGWSYIDLTKMTDVANINEVEGEYLTYMQRVGGGDEFRQNDEMLARWFTPSGDVDTKKVKEQTSLYPLIMPSAERALTLNKAYKVTVNEQSFLYGRDTVISPAKNVLIDVDTDVAPLPPNKRYNWDIRLDWSSANSDES
ncbi:MAG: hypothetical protein ACI93R_004054 [Flavobacteriales bacterium]|jgi:hypothetical protein